MVSKFDKLFPSLFHLNICVNTNSRIFLLVHLLTWKYGMKIWSKYQNQCIENRKRWKHSLSNSVVFSFTNPIFVVGNAGSSGTRPCYRFCKRKQFPRIYDFRFSLEKPKKSWYCSTNVSLIDSKIAKVNGVKHHLITSGY